MFAIRPCGDCGHGWLLHPRGRATGRCMGGHFACRCSRYVEKPGDHSVAFLLVGIVVIVGFVLATFSGPHLEHLGDNIVFLWIVGAFAFVFLHLRRQ